MSSLIDAFKILFNKTKTLEQLKLEAFASLSDSNKELHTKGIEPTHMKELETFLLLGEGDPTESFLFYQDLLTRMIEPRDEKTFFEIRQISLDLYRLSEKDYAEYHRFRNQLEEQYVAAVQNLIQNEAKRLGQKLDAAYFFSNPNDDDMIH